MKHLSSTSYLFPKETQKWKRNIITLFSSTGSNLRFILRRCVAKFLINERFIENDQEEDQENIEELTKTLGGVGEENKI